MLTFDETQPKVLNVLLILVPLVENCQVNFVILKHASLLLQLLQPFGPTAYFTISDLVMRHDIPDLGNMSEQYPHLIFHNFKSRLGERVKRFEQVVQQLFKQPFFISTLYNVFGWLSCLQ